ncbi:M23 family metallopeptidase [Rhizomonospora bruguierae]|uniref:M23 family metallopeptidase n=1 Tax=Rhizomonospora bruguierae TaxID=1581705 RepID=UPI001BCBFA5B|nr:M23 family metallopeptidase [Micromonospora sp. NBRC 107566]
MRQRLSSEPDRYRGRRRVPTPPRSRYAAVVTTAVVGAGVVAISAGAGLSDAKTVNPSTLPDLDTKAAAQLAERDAAADRSSRDTDRGGATTLSQTAPDVWLLPLHDYRFTSPYGVRWGKLHAGVDLSAPEGTPYSASHAGTVKLAGWYGGYGNAIIIDHGDGIETIYGHSSKILVRVGQTVQAGDVIGLVGNTGHSFGAHLHFELHVNGVAKDPVPYLRARGMDIQLETDTLYSPGD